VLEVVEVPVPRPRDPEQCTSPLFLATRKHLEGLIHRDRPLMADKLPVVRMTVVGDDVE
jgi:NitT/TauT family transport system ATP-binding protein